MTVRSFGDQLAAFSRKSIENAELASRRIALDLFGRVIMRTPVLTGRLRGNWQTSEGVRNTGTLEREDQGPSGAGIPAMGEAWGEAETVVTNWRLGRDLWLTNNLPYTARIEYQGHSKRKAPAGMVRVSVAEFGNLLQSAARGLR